MKKGYFVPAVFTSVLGVSQINAQDATKDSIDIANETEFLQEKDSLTKSNEKKTLSLFLKGESGATSPNGVVVDNNPGYLGSVSKDISDRIKAFLAVYHSDKPGFTPPAILGANVKLTDNLSTKGRLFVPLGDKKPFAVIESKLKLNAATLEAGHWNFLDGNHKNWLGVSVSKKLENLGVKVRSRILQVFQGDYFDLESTVFQAGVDKNLGKGWAVGGNLQAMKDYPANEFGTKVGFSISKSFNFPKKKR